MCWQAIDSKDWAAVSAAFKKEANAPSESMRVGTDGRSEGGGRVVAD